MTEWIIFSELIMLSDITGLLFSITLLVSILAVGKSFEAYFKSQQVFNFKYNKQVFIDFFEKNPSGVLRRCRHNSF